MQTTPLLISSLLTYASTYHPHREIVSRLCELPAGAPLHRQTYAQLSARCQRLAHALITNFHVSMGQTVATLAYNSHRHLECYYAVSSLGAILHTLNPRLYIEQVEWLLNHGGARVLLVDWACIDILNQLVKRGHMSHCRTFIILTDRKHMPAVSYPVLCYETVLSSASSAPFVWPSFCDTAASALLYTSGTTGNPKGVLFSHRSTVLHAWSLTTRDSFDLSACDVALGTIPLSHVSGWGLPYACVLVGCKIVLPGTSLDPASLYRLISEEGVTITGGVPTVWLGLLHHLDEQPALALPTLKRVLVGGSAVPPSMITRFAQRGIECISAYGMSEISPIATISRLLPQHARLSPAEQLRIKAKQGRPVFGVEMKTVNDAGETLPRDGQASGELQVRGPWVTKGYYKVTADGKPARTWQEQSNVDSEQWFATGDVSTLDEDGYMQIVDRSKDVVKSGGEWISSIDLENAAVGHQAVAEAAVIGIPHSKWQERPLLLVIPKPGKSVSEAEMLEFLKGKVAKWWLPDAVELVKELPHTATGKLLKTELRKRHKNYRFKSDKGDAQDAPTAMIRTKL
jgi:fatty-acyl-CoA synthase